MRRSHCRIRAGVWWVSTELQLVWHSIINLHCITQPDPFMVYPPLCWSKLSLSCTLCDWRVCPAWPTVTAPSMLSAGSSAAGRRCSGWRVSAPTGHTAPGSCPWCPGKCWRSRTGWRREMRVRCPYLVWWGYHAVTAVFPYELPSQHHLQYNKQLPFQDDTRCSIWRAQPMNFTTPTNRKIRQQLLTSTGWLPLKKVSGTEKFPISRP